MNALLQVIALVMQLYILSRIEATASNTEKVTVKTKNMKGCVHALPLQTLGLRQPIPSGGRCNCLDSSIMFREEKVEEMTVKKYDAKQSAEALQRVVLVRMGCKRVLQGCAALGIRMCACLTPASTVSGNFHALTVLTPLSCTLKVRHTTARAACCGAVHVDYAVTTRMA